MDTTVIVLFILAGVAATAMIYEPKRYFGAWRELADAFGTDRRPRSYPLAGQRLMLGSFLDMYEYGSFDVAADDEGLWLRYVGPSPRKCCESLLIPWDRLRLHETRGGYSGEELDVLAERPRRLVVPAEIIRLATTRLPRAPAAR